MGLEYDCGLRMFPGRLLLLSSESSSNSLSFCFSFRPFSILSSSSTARHRSSRVALRCCVMVPASCMPVAPVVTGVTPRFSTLVSNVNTLGPRGTGRGTAPLPLDSCSGMESSEDLLLSFLLLGDEDRERDRFLPTPDLCFLGLKRLSSFSLLPSSLELPLLLLPLDNFAAPLSPTLARSGMEVNG